MSKRAAGVVEGSGPDLSGELWQLSAGTIAAGIASGSFSAREVVGSCLGRVERVNPEINAIVELLGDEALAAAAEADRMVASGAELGPLHGVPVLTKINTDQKGVATSDGVVAYRENIASADSAQVAAMRVAGAIPYGRTNAPPFALRWFSENDLYGRTANPWSPDHTPGGSSGGAGAAVAAGFAPIAQGNDIAGSIRYPAYCCGVVGLRPTVGRMAGSGRPEHLDLPLCEQMITVEGPIAGSIADLRLALSCGARSDPRDPVLAPGAALEPSARTCKVALVRDVGLAPAAPAVSEALDQAAAWLGDVGYEVEEVPLDVLREAFELYLLLVAEELRPLRPVIEELADEGMKTAARGFYEVVTEWHEMEPTLEAYMQGYARRGTLIEQLSLFMAEHPIVLLPVSAEQAFEHDADLAGLASLRRVFAAQWPMISIPLLGFPALSVPTGVDGGLPTGVQLLGRRFAEEEILRAGAVIEARAGRFAPPDYLEAGD